MPCKHGSNRGRLPQIDAHSRSRRTLLSPPHARGRGAPNAQSSLDACPVTPSSSSTRINSSACIHSICFAACSADTGARAPTAIAAARGGARTRPAAEAEAAAAAPPSQPGGARGRASARRRAADAAAAASAIQRRRARRSARPEEGRGGEGGREGRGLCGRRRALTAAAAAARANLRAGIWVALRHGLGQSETSTFPNPKTPPPREARYGWRRFVVVPGELARPRRVWRMRNAS